MTPSPRASCAPFLISLLGLVGCLEHDGAQFSDDESVVDSLSQKAAAPPARVPKAINVNGPCIYQANLGGTTGTFRIDGSLTLPARASWTVGGTQNVVDNFMGGDNGDGSYTFTGSTGSGVDAVNYQITISAGGSATL